ncbi:hypothetical protein O7634_24540 [Micromonospora sp. WMMD1120]|uniref:hypothetical protein n=1 Tax=Micromonospora sp. WMMD1120 TaxID=3016106 RepID=UPI0024174A5C|nr:hypothetical protein [Micromonospora sp. WMMD1120]MDG4809932.1 hypothetical protein [Micromonospora sp. WMMD1120]
MSDRLTRCRYIRRNSLQCTGEAVDPDGEILLCGKYLARALQLVQIHMASARP